MSELTTLDLPVLHTTRLRLTVLQAAQAAPLLDFYQRNRAHLSPWEGERAAGFYTLEDTRARIERNLAAFQTGAAVPLVILEKEGEQVLGMCNFSNIVRGLFQACHLGYACDHAWQGKGLMFEALQSALAYMFEEVKLHRVMANYLPHNERSARLLERLGFEREGYAKAYLKIAGRWQYHVLTALVNHKLEE